MKLAILLAAGLLGCSLAAGAANADTIFDVEHARADARAGLVSENDLEFLSRWGGTSGYGYYPPPRYAVSPYRRGFSRRYVRPERRW
jgi:hypothetical protein